GGGRFSRDDPWRRSCFVPPLRAFSAHPCSSIFERKIIVPGNRPVQQDFDLADVATTVVALVPAAGMNVAYESFRSLIAKFRRLGGTASPSSVGWGRHDSPQHLVAS